MGWDMKKISKAVYAKSMIAASVALCIGMGQNCAPSRFAAMDGNDLVTKSSAAVDPDGLPVAGGAIQDTGNEMTTPPSSPPAAESDDDCMKVEKIEEEHLPKVATLDEHHKPSKILICHGSGQSGKSHELLLPLTAVEAHLAHHHDYLGACGQPAVKTCHPKGEGE